MKTAPEMYDKIIKIAENDERIRAAYIHGSRANPNAAHDKYSDYDIVFVVTEVATFAENNNWLNAFGDIAFVFESLKCENVFFEKELNDLSRFYAWCVLLKDGSRIDLLAEIKEEAMKSKFTATARTLVLLDKDNCLPDVPYENRADSPGEAQYAACRAGFWWFLSDVAKAVARDQVPYAQEQFNALIRPALNQMLCWHINSRFQISTGKGTQNFKKYLSEDFYALYTKTYSDCANFKNAVFFACELFDKAASDVADYFGFTYKQENNMKKYSAEMLSCRN